MKIADIKVGMISIPLKKTFKTALRTVSTAELVAVKIETDIGLVGYGDAPISGAVTGDTRGSIFGAIEHIKPKLLGMLIDDFNETMKILDNSILGNSVAKAAIDIAIYDLICKSYKVPLYSYLGGINKEIFTNMTIGINELEVMVRDSVLAVERGFENLKIKVGQNPNQDLARLKSIRKAVGEDIKIRIDANQAWNSKDAIKFLRKVEDEGLNIELVEQPVKANDIEGLKRVTDNVDISVLADESVFSPRDALRVLEMRAADIISIKLMKAGGIHNALKICTLAETYGVECLIGSMLESKISITAATHLAISKSIITKVDLDGPLFFGEDSITGGIQYDDAKISASREPGLGIETINNVKWL